MSTEATSYPLIFFPVEKHSFVPDSKRLSFIKSLIINPHLSVNCVVVSFLQLVAIFQKLDSASLKVSSLKN